MIKDDDIIASGVPCAVIKLNPDGTTEKAEYFNMENFEVQDWQIDHFARALLPEVQAFYMTEEGQAIAAQLQEETEAKKASQKSRAKTGKQKKMQPKKMNLYQAIHARIKNLCKERGYSYYQIVKAIPPLQNKSSEIPMDAIDQVCIKLKISVADFFSSHIFRNLEK